MQSINIRFAASANFADVQKQVSALQGQLAQLQKQATAASTGVGGMVNPAALKRQTAQIDDIRSRWTELVNAQGKYGVQAVKMASATETMTDALQRQQITLKQTLTNMRTLNNVRKEQLALQHASVAQWKTDATGKISADIIIPKELPNALDTMSQKMRFWNKVVASNSVQMINWGKNTQWAGRQLMVGFTVPFIALGAAAGMMAYNVDKELVRVQKVYDTTATDLAGQEAELAQLRTESFNMSTDAANKYGAAVTDTLNVEAGLAATGVRGADLLQQTNMIMRIATLGEIEHQQALEMTIALQNAFGLSTEEVAEKMNFMNTIENATSLSIQDIAEATPRAATAMASLGVSVEQMTVLLVAMKERGVDAAEGANALKSATTRLLRPTPQAQEIFREMFGADIMEIATKNAGNLFGILQDLAVVMKDAPTVERAQALSALFGTYQFNRLNAALAGITEAMGGVGSESSQTAMAMEQMLLTPGEHAATADRELQRWQQSASGQIKRAVETIKAELAELGEFFLPLLAMVVKGIASIMDWFNKLPSGVKTAVLALAGIAAIIGPLVMLVGLFANFAGNIIKFGTFMASLALRFNVVNANQRAAALLAGAASVKFTEEARAASLLTTELTKLTSQVTALNAARGVPAAQGGTIAQGTYKTGAQQGQSYFYNTQTGRRVSAEDAKNAGFIAQSAEKAKQGFGAAAVKAGTIAAVGVAGISMMTGATGTLVNVLNTAVMTALLIGPAISKGFLGAGVSKMFSGMTNAIGNVGKKIPSAITSKFAGAGMAVKGIGASLAGLMGPIALVAAGVTLLIFKMRSELKKAEENQNKIAESTKDWATILGFVETKVGDVVDEQGNVQKGAASIASEIKEANEPLVNSIKNARTEQEAFNIALMEGIKIARAGGSPENVRSAMEALLGLRFTDEQVAELMLKVNLDFTDAAATFEAQIQQWENELGKISRNDFAQGNWEGFTRIFTGTDDLNAEARQAAENIGREFWKQLSQTSDEQQSGFFNQFAQGMDQTQVAVFDKIAEGNEKLFSENNIKNADDLMKAYGMLTNSTSRYGESVMEAFSPEFRQLIAEHGEELKQNAQMEMEVAQGMLREAGVSGDLIDKVTTLAQAKRILNQEDRASLGATTDAANAKKLYNMAIQESTALGEKMTAGEQLSILNTYRRMAGLAAATSIEQGFGDSVRGSTDALDDNTNAVNENMMTNEEWASAVQNATQSTFGGARDFALSVADQFLTEKNNAIIEGIRKAGERRDEALDAAAEAQEKRFDMRRDAMEARYEASLRAHDARWERIMDQAQAKWERREKSIQAYYDARIDKIDQAIEAEQKAEELRQRIFEAEKARIQRLQEMFSRNIDFNQALNTGNLDEAAKIMNDARSATEQWAIEDAQVGAGDASQLRIDALNKQKDALQAELKRRLEAIKIQEEAEKKALEAKKRREMDSLQHAREVWNKELQAEQERYNKGVAAARKANQERTANSIAESQRRLDIDKRNLELELLAIRASTPRNKKEYEEQIRQIQVVYDKYGVDLKAKGSAWSKTIGSGLTANIAASAASLRNDINWRKFAADIAGQITSGAFGMTVAQFMTWIRTGQLPAKGGKSVDGVMMRYLSGKTGFLHTGGPVGAEGGRPGYPSGGNLFSDEIPLIGKAGEYMMSDKAHKKYGTDFFDRLNEGKIPKDQGGPELGMAGLIAGMAVGAIKYAALQQMMLTGMATIKTMMGMAAATTPGKYGGTTFDATQLRNAGTIVTVGKRFGANSRDLIVSLMAAMQESTLRNLNYGDRDSLGLFQQRAGWGSVAQRTTPAIAAEMFFTGGKKGPGTPGLLDIKNRASLSLSRAAQAVQRSAYPDAYAKWEDEARAILAGGGGSAVSGPLSPGGWLKPVAGRVTSPFGMRRHPITGVYKLHDGTDIGASSGTAIRATKPGRITRASYAGGYGNWTVMDHGGGWTSAYAHQSRFAKRSGSLSQGATLGYVGMTGNTTGPHLHFMIGKNGKWVNPASYVPGLIDGGTVKFDNTIANLHARETVLTEPLSDDLKRGIRGLDSGNNSSYNVDITFTGPVNTEIDFEKGVERAIRKAEKRRGPNRRVGVS